MDDPNGRKIFPRNLTANADFAVRGNPANARPESGVDNTHPGLEFDQRNLDQTFFPGLVFEFQFLLGAKLVGVDPALLLPETDLRPSDVDDGAYLWYLYGAFGAAPDETRLMDVFGLDGYEVLRIVHDLEPGPLVLVVGQPPDPADHGQLTAWLENGLDFAAVINRWTKGGKDATANRTLREDGGKFLAAILVGERAQCLDADGVIQRSAAPPGGLTRSLCAPWQWDFADCGCHYWAANKPDIVIGRGGGEQWLNFQRDRPPNEGPAAKPPPQGHLAWTDGQMTQQQMVMRWEELPFVIGEREVEVVAQLPAPEAGEIWTRQQIIDELTYLAGVEHALCVEYLYAHYSLDAPMKIENLGKSQDRKVFHAAHEVFKIAVDEMRHFRLVNEALLLLGAPVCLERATTVGQKENQVTGSFNLLPLTPKRLDFFISVEKPSQHLNAHPNNLDGLYTRILASLHARKGEYEDTPALWQQLVEVIKLIIEEGVNHFERFTLVKALLADCTGYLRLKGGPKKAKGGDVLALQKLGDSYYHTMLNGLHLAFAMGESNRDGLLKQARRSMHSLHDAGHLLAEHHSGLLFTPFRPFAAEPAALRREVDRLRADSHGLLDQLKQSPHESTRTLAVGHAHVMRELIAGTHESMGRSAR